MGNHYIWLARPGGRNDEEQKKEEKKTRIIIRKWNKVKSYFLFLLLVGWLLHFSLTFEEFFPAASNKKERDLLETVGTRQRETLPKL